MGRHWVLRLAIATLLVPVTAVAGSGVCRAEDRLPAVPLSGFEDPSTHGAMDPMEGERTDVAFRPLPPTDVDVWFHVISAGPTLVLGDVPREQLEIQMDVLDEAFAGSQGGAPTPFSFTLAGVTRTTNASWYQMTSRSAEERAAKTALRTGDQSTLNVYVALTRGSWATFPWWYRSDPLRDGVVLSNLVLPGGAGAPSNLGDVLVHEAGHWLGLYHTFQGGCEADGDFVDDTPAEARSSGYGCPMEADTCPAEGTDPVHNFMDYTADLCQWEFTGGQVERMEMEWRWFRE